MITTIIVEITSMTSQRDFQYALLKYNSSEKCPRFLYKSQRSNDSQNYRNFWQVYNLPSFLYHLLIAKISMKFCKYALSVIHFRLTKGCYWDSVEISSTENVSNHGGMEPSTFSLLPDAPLS